MLARNSQNICRYLRDVESVACVAVAPYGHTSNPTAPTNCNKLSLTRNNSAFQFDIVVWIFHLYVVILKQPVLKVDQNIIGRESYLCSNVDHWNSPQNELLDVILEKGL